MCIVIVEKMVQILASLLSYYVLLFYYTSLAIHLWVAAYASRDSIEETRNKKNI